MEKPRKAMKPWDKPHEKGRKHVDSHPETALQGFPSAEAAHGEVGRATYDGYLST